MTTKGQATATTKTTAVAIAIEIATANVTAIATGDVCGEGLGDDDAGAIGGFVFDGLQGCVGLV